MCLPVDISSLFVTVYPTFSSEKLHFLLLFSELMFLMTETMFHKFYILVIAITIILRGKGESEAP
jgi:hypothetical protein